ncbi:hypothetical protein FD755_002730 [Muntiacus reevesi]|uniref:Small monomeric GTPase n=1 Tax=Muntiacus reevesi TaxID=9886 RepID=A0A5J5N705_MUNRE|nr:hypothetical protein FD755_002730 [Muntiacus reevesi]
MKAPVDGGSSGRTALPSPWGGGDAHKLSSGRVGNRRRLPGVWFGRQGEDVVTEEAEQIGERIVRALGSPVHIGGLTHSAPSLCNQHSWDLEKCGRFKKEIVVDGQSYLLLIRDEGGPPEAQFAMWVDAVIFVFSLEDEISFQTVYHYYSRMANYRNTSEIPLVLVGTQDAISSTNPRVIDDARARKLSSDLKRCTYYETCATYGLNVERVFQDVSLKVNIQKTKIMASGPINSWEAWCAAVHGVASSQT